MWIAPTVKSDVTAWVSPCHERVRRVHQHQGEAEDQADGPEQQLRDQRHRRRRGEDRVLDLVGPRHARERDERVVHALVHDHGELLEALGLSRQDEDEEDADHRHEDDEEPDDVFDVRTRDLLSPARPVDTDFAESVKSKRNAASSRRSRTVGR